MLLFLFLLLLCLNLPPLTDQMPQAGNEAKNVNATKAPPAAKLPPMNVNGTLNLIHYPNEHDLHEMTYALYGIVDLMDNDTDSDEAMTKEEVDQYMAQLEQELQKGRHKGRDTSLQTDEVVVLIEPVSMLVTLGGLILKAAAGAAISYGVNKGLAAFAPSGSDPLPYGTGRACGHVWWWDTDVGGTQYKGQCSGHAKETCRTYNEKKRYNYLCVLANDDGEICARVYDYGTSWWTKYTDSIHHYSEACTRKRDGETCVKPEWYTDVQFGDKAKLCVVTETRLTQWCREAREDKQQARKNIKEGLDQIIDIGDANRDGKLTHDEAYEVLLDIGKKEKLEFNLDYIMCGLEGLGYYKAQFPKLGAANSTTKKP